MLNCETNKNELNSEVYVIVCPPSLTTAAADYVWLWRAIIINTVSGKLDRKSWNCLGHVTISQDCWLAGPKHRHCCLTILLASPRDCDISFAGLETVHDLGLASARDKNEFEIVKTSC